MKKNKKLFAILTLVAFMMTLMPVMAFAAPDTVELSSLTIESGKGYIDVVAKRAVAGPAVTADLVLKDVDTSKLEIVEITTPSSYSLRTNGDFPVSVTIPVNKTEGRTRILVDDGYSVGEIVGPDATITPAPASGTTFGPTVKPLTSDDIKQQLEKTFDANQPSNRKSVVSIVGGNASVEREVDAVESKIDADAANTVEIQLVPRNAKERIITAPIDMYVWVEEDGLANQASDTLVLSSKDSINVTSVEKLANHVYKVKVTGVASVYAQFLSSGKYTVKASFESSAGTAPTFGGTAKIISESGANTITVTAKAANTRDWGIRVKYDNKIATPTIQKNVFITDVAVPSTGFDQFATGTGNVVVLKDGGKAGDIEVAANTVATTPVTITVYDDGGNGTHELVNKYPVKITSGSANVELSKDGVVAGNDGLTLTTNYTGNATFDVAGLREGEYKLYVTIGDYESTLIVKVGATAANEIQTIKFPSNPIATDTDSEDYKDIFRFQLTDANGNIVAQRGPTKGAESATATTPTGDQPKFVSIVKAPEANKVRNADVYIKLVQGDTPAEDKDYYTFGFVNGKKFEAEGDYEVRVVLENGKSVTVPFSVKKFDKAVSLHIEYPTEAVELNAVTDVPDIYFLDANNVMKKANNRVTVAATGYAVAGIQQNGRDAGVLKVKNDEKYLGQTITVTAVAEKENLVATTTLTVTDSAQSVKLDTNRGQVNAANRVGFKLVNSNGQAVALGDDTNIDEVTCIVTNVENPDAKVSFSVAGSTKSDLKTKGTGVVVLSSNKETTATVQIMVKVTKKVSSDSQQDNNTGLSTTYYTGTETFTFGAEADKSVVMTIGSREIVANNVPATIDVAPFIKDNRTFVPFRALVEAFGAEVNYDEATSTVTTKLDGKTVVLTVGSTVLTVNDETVTMDVAPYIVNDRVVVPVRFVGEAFGFTVEATQDAETGATASVVFYQK